MFEDAIIRYVQAEPTEDVRDVISPLLEDADAIDLNSYPARLAYSLCRVKKLFDDDSIHRLDTSVLPNRDYLVFKKSASEACDVVLDIYRLVVSGRRSDALQKLYTYYFESGLVEHCIRRIDKDTRFYRVRASDSYSLYSEDEMFHIPFEKCYKTANYRYSISGLPILYFGSSVYGCWLESNQPEIDRANVALYNINADVRCLCMKMPTRKDWVTKEALQILPLVLACSKRVQYPKEPFKPEYAIPQLLTECVLRFCQEKELDYILGINYISTKMWDEGNFFYGRKCEELYENYAFPPVTHKFSGVCPKLKEAFIIERVTSLFNETHIRPIKTVSADKSKSKSDYWQSSFGKLQRLLEPRMLVY